MLGRLMSAFFIIVCATLAFTMIHQAFLIFSVSFYEEGCKDAGLKLRRDYGPKYQVYMDRFCSARVKMIKREFNIEE
jgi:hypothetical protein